MGAQAERPGEKAPVHYHPMPPPSLTPLPRWSRPATILHRVHPVPSKSSTWESMAAWQPKRGVGADGQWPSTGNQLTPLLAVVLPLCASVPLLWRDPEESWWAGGSASLAPQCTTSLPPLGLCLASLGLILIRTHPETPVSLRVNVALEIEIAIFTMKWGSFTPDRRPSR